MSKKRIPEIHIEWSSDPSNLYYMSVIQYRKEHHLVVIDNITDDTVTAYAIDKASQEGLEIKDLLSVINRWFYSASSKHPLSIEFSKCGLTDKTNKILKTFDLNNVTRIVGHDFRFQQEQPKVRRRKVQRTPTTDVDIMMGAV